MREFVIAVLGLTLCSFTALAGAPNPVFCEVTPADFLNGLFMAPLVPASAPASINLITVRNSSNNTIANAVVTVFLTERNVICGSTILTAVTDANGRATITLGGGGCADGVPLSGVIKANGTTIRAYENVKSSDYDGLGGDLDIDLADLIAFAAAFLGPTGSGGCHDYNNDGDVGLPELVMFSGIFINRSSCAP